VAEKAGSIGTVDIFPGPQPLGFLIATMDLVIFLSEIDRSIA
jgi:hypothetical protein